MAKSRESFERRQRERAKKAKAEAKRERRLSPNEDEPGTTTTEAGPRVDENAVIGKLAELHAAYDNEEISFDDFETARSELLTRLQVD
jgi:hypothetical protein